MANTEISGKKISEVAERTELTGNEMIPFAEGGNQGKIGIDTVKEYVQPDLSGYAKTTDIPSLDGYLTEQQAEEDYQPKGDYVNDNEVLTRTNTETYTPTGDYNPATKKYVEDSLKAANIEDLLSYGIERGLLVSDPDALTRIGNPNLHREAPVQNAMRGCLLADDGSVTKYLDPEDWTGETRDGSRGQVMVEVPDHYMRFELVNGDTMRVRMSSFPLGGYIKVSKYYVAAYEATVHRSANKLCSVVNTTADYRGGNNQADWDGTYRSMLGIPASMISRANFRTYARNRGTAGLNGCGWNCNLYHIQKDLYWLFVIEHGTLNTQKAYNATRDENGYVQGGLGDGVTTWDLTSWSNHNGNHGFIPCGTTDSLGNKTGVVNYTLNLSSGTKQFSVPRYHGIENLFGHLWKWTDGANVRIQPGSGLRSVVYVCEDPSKFNDTNYDGYTYVGDEARAEGYVKRMIFGNGGEIMPSEVGGSSTTFYCDYHYTSIPASETLRGVLFGGCANDGADAGFVYAFSNCVPSLTGADIGSRLCFLPAAA